MKYWIVDCFHEDRESVVTDLVNEVADFLEIGWCPTGGIALAFSPHGRNYGDGKITDGWVASQALIHDGEGLLPE